MSIVTRFLAWRHGGMAEFYEMCTAGLEDGGVGAVRSALGGDLRGHILEIGCGTGRNFPHYGTDVRVTAIEPVDEYRRFAAARARSAAANITVLSADAQALPFADASFDAALETLVLCSVPHVLRGLSELHRVVRPGGPVRFFEHVRSERRIGALVQDFCNPVWCWAMDGCNINRDPVEPIRQAGFTVERVTARTIDGAGAPPFPFREIHARA